jgi:acetyl esterase/lipase
MSAAAEIVPERLTLYEGRPPFSHEAAEPVLPYADLYRALPEVDTGRLMLAFPGGAYRFLSKLSGADYGVYFAARGVSVLSVSFRLGSQGYDGRAICADALAAVRLAHDRAASLRLDPARIGVIGTSAGGHLAGMLSTGAAELLLRAQPEADGLPLAWRPDFALFCYAVLSLEPPLRHLETARHFLGAAALDPRSQRAATPLRHVGADHCRSFLWHTTEDTEVSLDNTLEMYRRLRGHGVPSELHVFEKGPHALGLARELKRGAVLHWADDAVRWIADAPVEAVIPPSI